MALGGSLLRFAWGYFAPLHTAPRQPGEPIESGLQSGAPLTAWFSTLEQISFGPGIGNQQGLQPFMTVIQLIVW